jgi:hypothetical protein
LQARRATRGTIDGTAQTSNRKRFLGLGTKENKGRKFFFFEKKKQKTFAY